MGAVFASAARAPLTSLASVVEMTESNSRIGTGRPSARHRRKMASSQSA